MIADRSRVSFSAARGKYRFGPSRTRSSTSDVIGLSSLPLSPPSAQRRAHGVESAVDMDDLAGRLRQEVAEQGDDRLRGRLDVREVPPGGRPPLPLVLE